ncbi:MAG: GNAT family N-acetyltransferase [Clostridia bacterium]|nr:GNAT family N-acetyltransferase [Clostridia bacterium]
MKTMVHLRKITKENLDAVLELKTTKEQEAYVSTVAHSLAQAWVYRDTAYPFAVYDDEVLVGFVMMGFYESKQQYTLWKLLIDERYQHRGYGKQAVELAKQYLIDTFGVAEIYLGVHEDNETAIRLYQSTGFTATGETDGMLIEMKWTA